MFFNSDTSLRMIFDAVAPAYDEARPRYPKEMYQDLRRLGVLPEPSEGAYCLEIGSGSGQATVDLIEFAARVDCIEPGASMCAKLREKFTDASRIHIQQRDFEQAELSRNYRLIFAGNSLHWTEKSLAFKKIRQHLEPGGWFVGVWNLPGFSEAVYRQADAILRPHDENFSIPIEAPHHTSYFAEGMTDFASRGFSNCQYKIYRVQRQLNLPEIVDLLWSYVGVQEMTPAERRAVYSALAQAIGQVPESDWVVDDVYFDGFGQHNDPSIPT